MPATRTHLSLHRLSDEALLGTRICDLDLRADRGTLGRRVRRLHHELRGKRIPVMPHVWLSTEWFSPVGVPGIAIPFYLAHPRLVRLERRFMHQVEGGSEDQCMRILRHEAGHAIDSAYRLHRKKRYRELFGRAAEPYPEHYSPRAASKRHVHHLGFWYAQAHPLEDFAETFAVWLRPYSRWRSSYEGWPAMKKLDYVDTVMREIRTVHAPVHSTAMPERLSTMKITLGDFYAFKRERYLRTFPRRIDERLRALFPDTRGRSLATSLQKARAVLRARTSKHLDRPVYNVDQALSDLIERCRELDLRVSGVRGEGRIADVVDIAVDIAHGYETGKHRIVM